MGLFDNVRFSYPLPIPQAQGELFQTKDLENQLGTYVVEGDGSLWRVDYDIEDRSDPNATGLVALARRMTRVNPRPTPYPYSGVINLYGDYPVIDPITQARAEGVVELVAVFANGQMTQLSVVEHQKPALEVALEARQKMDGALGRSPHPPYPNGKRRL